MREWVLTRVQQWQTANPESRTNPVQVVQSESLDQPTGPADGELPEPSLHPDRLWPERTEPRPRRSRGGVLRKALHLQFVIPHSALLGQGWSRFLRASTQTEPVACGRDERTGAVRLQNSGFEKHRHRGRDTKEAHIGEKAGRGVVLGKKP